MIKFEEGIGQHVLTVLIFEFHAQTVFVENEFLKL